MAKSGSKSDTAAVTDTLWVVMDSESGEIVRTSKGLLAVYTTRADARAARQDGRVRTDGTSIVPFCELDD